MVAVVLMHPGNLAHTWAEAVAVRAGMTRTVVRYFVSFFFRLIDRRVYNMGRSVTHLPKEAARNVIGGPARSTARLDNGAALSENNH